MSLIRLGRLKFLQYSPILYNLGAVVALLEGAEFRLLPWALGLGFVWLVHAGTHYCNEYYDLPADRLNRNPSPWTGGSRVLVNGELDPKVSIQTSSVAFAFAAALALGLPSGYCQALAALIILLSWGYSVPPIRLAWRGFGETTVIAVLNLGVPLLGCALLLGELPLLLWLTLLPLIPISFTRMLIMNMADADSDRAAGKRTLVVKLGMAMSSRLHRLGLATAYLLLPVAVSLGLPIDAAICLFIGSGPLALWISHRVAHWHNWTFDLPLIASIHNALATILLFAPLWSRLPPNASTGLLLVPVLGVTAGTLHGLLRSRHGARALPALLAGIAAALLFFLFMHTHTGIPARTCKPSKPTTSPAKTAYLRERQDARAAKRAYTIASPNLCTHKA